MQQLSPQEIVSWLSQCKASGDAPLLLDVREPWETQLVRITHPDAETVEIPMQQIPGRLEELDPDRPIACYCHHGMRSLQVALFLESRGFENVRNITGGIDAWAADIEPALSRY